MHGPRASATRHRVAPGVYFSAWCATLAGMPWGTAQGQGDLERRVLGALRQRLRDERRTITAAAKAVGVDRSQLSLYLSGHKPMRLTEFLRLCDFLGVDPAVVIADAEA